MAVARRVDTSTVAVELNGGPDTDRVSGSSIVVKNVGLADVYIGGSNVETTTGFTLQNGDVISVECGKNDKIFAISASASRVEVLVAGL